MIITWVQNTKTASFRNAESSWELVKKRKTWGIKNIQVKVTQPNEQDNACKCLTKLQ